MALLTGGTTLTTSLNGLKFLQGIGSMPAADVASLSNSIKGDANPTHPLVPGAFTAGGLLHIPGGRGILQIRPGDYVFVDSQGWPILVSANSIANAAWIHS